MGVEVERATEPSGGTPLQLFTSARTLFSKLLDRLGAS